MMWHYMYWVPATPENRRTALDLFAGNSGSDACVGFGSEAVVQGSSLFVRCAIRSGNSASEFPELEVERT